MTTEALTQPIRLTPDICALAHRPVVDPGPTEGLSYLSDAEYEALIAETLAGRPDPQDIWVFAYGSLIWKPAFPTVESRIATLKGWHRAFCLKTTRWRGTPERPGLMMALQRGGQCQGVAYRLAAENLRHDLDALFRRELGVKPLNQKPRWLHVESYEGNVRALAFTADPRGRSYVGKLPLEEAAVILAEAVGVWGTGADYLRETIAHLEKLGIRDTGLWRLQSLVAQNILAKNRVTP